MLSSVSQLSLEYKGRHYGNGVLKIEPSTLKSALVFAPKNIKLPVGRFNSVSRLLQQGKKVAASDLATSIVREHSTLPDDYWDQVQETLTAIRSRRRQQ